LPKDYRIASGQFLKGIGKPQGNAQITQRTAGHMFPLAGYDEKPQKDDYQPIGDNAELPGGCQKKNIAI
jgi:hypothetical protein